jgi:hypothetical protein
MPCGTSSTTRCRPCTWHALCVDPDQSSSYTRPPASEALADSEAIILKLADMLTCLMQIPHTAENPGHNPLRTQTAHQWRWLNTLRSQLSSQLTSQHCSAHMYNKLLSTVKQPAACMVHDKYGVASMHAPTQGLLSCFTNNQTNSVWCSPTAVHFNAWRSR